MRNLLYRYRVAIVLVMVLLVAAAGVLLYIFYAPNDFGEEQEKVFVVWKGQSFASIVDSLEERQIIRDRALFVFVARVYGGTNKIRVGRYVFKSGTSNSHLYLSLREGWDNEPITVVIPEGLLSRTQAKIFSRHLGTDSARFVSLVNDPDLASSLGINAASLEGYLLPDSYRFFWQTDEKDIIVKMVQEFNRFYSDSLHEQARKLGWSTDQVVTLASIVEGEAILNEERARISGVYHNRLKKGMRLEADPTIQYFISDGPRRLLYSDLKLDHPYNTYRYAGLPPGPVNNPGRGSILAALFPEENRDLFFVANGKGGHWFSATYAEHLRYVRQYRRDRRNRRSQYLTQVEPPK
jgi:peptidoglycan lytic transglycosylase G